MPPGPVPLAVDPGVSEPENVDVALPGIDESGVERPVAVAVDVWLLKESGLDTVEALGALGGSVLVRLPEAGSDTVDASELAKSMLAVLSGSEGVCADAKSRRS